MAGATAPPQGIGEVFGMALETTYGTAIAPGSANLTFRPVSNSLARKDPWMPLSISGSAVAMRNGRAVRLVPDVSGTVVVEADYDDIGVFFLYALGNYSSETVSASEYTHVNALEELIPATTPQSFTAFRETELEQFSYAGCMIDNLEISGAAGRLVTVSADIIGQSGGDADIAGVLAGYTAAPFVEFHDSILRADFTAINQTLTDVADGQQSGAEALDWTVRFENGFRAQAAAGVRDGSGNPLRAIRQPTWGGYRRATMTVSRDYFDDNFFDMYHASAFSPSATGALGTFELYCESNENISSTPYTLSIVFNSGYIPELNADFGGGPDVLGETVTIEAAYATGVSNPVDLTLVNGFGTQYNDMTTAIV